MDLKEFCYRIWIPIILLINYFENTNIIYSILTYLTVVMLFYIDYNGIKNTNIQNKSTQAHINVSNKNKSCQTYTIQTEEKGIQENESKNLTSTASQTSKIENKEESTQKTEEKNLISTSSQTCNVQTEEKAVQINENKNLTSIASQTWNVQTEEKAVQINENKNLTSTSSQTYNVETEEKAVQINENKNLTPMASQTSIIETEEKATQKNDHKNLTSKASQTIYFETRDTEVKITESILLFPTEEKPVSTTYNETEEIINDNLKLPTTNQILKDNICKNSPPKYNEPANDPFFSLSSLSVLPSSSSELHEKKKKNGWGRFKKYIKKIVKHKKIKNQK